MSTELKWEHPHPDYQIYKHWSSERKNWDSHQIALSRWLHCWVDGRRLAWSSLRRKNLTMQQFIELLMCLATDDVPCNQRMDYIKNFKPHSRNRGRPRKSKLASPLSETVSEEQPHASEDEAKPSDAAPSDRDPHGRPSIPECPPNHSW